jgi:hypothetical protein
MNRYIFCSVVWLILLTSYLNAQTTAIPDTNFEQALIDLGIDSDGEINNKVLTSDVASVLSLDVSGKGIMQLTGIEDFINLSELYCQDNLITSLTLSSNTKLTILDCSENDLSSLKLTELVSLKVLKCSFNKITGFNLSNNKLLEEVHCDHNLIKTLNLKDNSELTVFNCSNNQLAVLTITFNWKLKYFDFSSNLFTYIDLSNNLKVEYLNSSNNPLTSIFLNNMIQLQSIYMVDNDLLTNVNFSHNYKLEEIVCRDNDLLASINLSATLALTHLDCRNNSLTELETLYNPLLENLYCQNNQIKALDLSQNPNLAFLKCNDNQLETLDLKNSSNELMAGGITKYDGQLIYVDGMDARNNPPLLCIQVDNEKDASLGLAPYDSWFKDVTVSYFENCEVNLGIDQQVLNNSICVYPNPSENHVVIKADNQQIEKVVIYSILGSSVKEYYSEFANISLKAISPGLYFLGVYTENGVAVKRFIIK